MSQAKIQSYALGIAFVFCLLASSVFLFSTVTDKHVDNFDSLDNRINPNVAPVSSLVRLPGIGLSKGWAVVAYRQKNGNSRIFKSCDDLTAVKGIGPKTAEAICGYLKFGFPPSRE